MSGNSSKKIAFNYFGGKFTWLEDIYNYFPSQFTHLADAFGGSFCITLNYEGKVIKTVNEINQDITNFFEVLRDYETELIRLLELTPCSKAEFDKCWEKTPDKIEAARRFYVRIRQSFFSLGASLKNKGWHMAVKTCNAYGGETVSKWNNAIPKLHEVAQTLRKGVQITNYDVFDFIDKLDFEDIFFYLDPPYLLETRASKNDYLFEFSRNQHIQLAERLQTLKGKAMISGYDSELYNQLYHSWNKIAFPSKKNNIRTGEVTEVIWFNYPIEETKMYLNQKQQLKYGTPLSLKL